MAGSTAAPTDRCRNCRRGSLTSSFQMRANANACEHTSVAQMWGRAGNANSCAGTGTSRRRPRSSLTARKARWASLPPYCRTRRSRCPRSAKVLSYEAGNVHGLCVLERRMTALTLQRQTKERAHDAGGCTIPFNRKFFTPPSRDPPHCLGMGGRADPGAGARRVAHSPAMGSAKPSFIEPHGIREKRYVERPFQHQPLHRAAMPARSESGNVAVVRDVRCHVANWRIIGLVMPAG
jgi:hypothetical protein